jgi:hypothetical protein
MEEEEDEGATHQPLSTSRFYSDFDIIGELGHGSFGSVYKVRSYTTNTHEILFPLRLCLFDFMVYSNQCYWQKNIK